MEVSGYLVGSAAFKAVGTSEPRPAGSIPVHLRQSVQRRAVQCQAVLGRKPYVLRLETYLRRGTYREGAELRRREGRGRQCRWTGGATYS